MGVPGRRPDRRADRPRHPHHGEAFALRGPAGAFQAVAYSPDGRALAAAHGFAGKEPGAVLIAMDTASGRELWRVAERGMQILALAYSPDGLRVATAGEDRIVRVWDVETGTRLAALTGRDDGVRDVAFAPDGRHLVSVGGVIGLAVGRGSRPCLASVHCRMHQKDTTHI